MANKISKIAIKNVKGIENKTFDLNLLPNKLHILVAPNGCGKSSFAIAFQSLKTKKIQLEENDHYYQANDQNQPSLSIYYFDGTVEKELIANTKCNYISTEFDTFVINSQLTPAAKTRSFGGHSSSTASLEIKPVVLVNTIPEKVEIDYSVRQMQSLFGLNGKILFSIKDAYLQKEILIELEDKIDWSKFTLKSTQATLNSALTIIRSLTGSKEDIISQINANIVDSFITIPPFKEIMDILRRHNQAESEANLILVSWQVLMLRTQHTEQFKKNVKYNRYLHERDFYCQILTNFNSSKWKKIAPKESKGQLIVEFPKATHLSNGQRDILTLILLLLQAFNKLKKPKCILIIDEIFDYLDEANLITFQYQISKMIKEFKEQNKEFYPLLLTHLDSGLFRHYRLNKNLVTHWLEKSTYSDGLHFMNLINKRSEVLIRDNVSKHFFHYYPEEKDLSSEFLSLQIKQHFAKSHSFYNLIFDEVKKYLKNEEADPLAICCALRIKIEKNIYDTLSVEEHRHKFLETNETLKKLEFASQYNQNIPEIYFLLSIIYNATLHQNPVQQDIVSPLIGKLTNPTIQIMIKSVFEDIVL